MEVERATFDKIKNAQLELEFDHVATLIKGKDTVSEDSRREFFDLLATSLLGQEVGFKFIFNYEGKIYDLGDLPVFIRKMAYFEDTQDKKQEVLLKGKPTRVPIEELWKSFRDNLYIPMAKAQTLALKTSSELLKSDSKGFAFTPAED